MNNTEYAEIISMRLKDLMEESNLNELDLATKTYVDVSIINKLLNSNWDVDTQSLFKIADFV